MRRKRDRIDCPRCGKNIGARTDGSGPVSHKCPHGRYCRQPAYRERGQQISRGLGVHASAPSCEECEKTREAAKVAREVDECTCYHTCAEDPATACSLSGDFHVHAGEPCPSHPDAPGDH